MAEDVDHPSTPALESTPKPKRHAVRGLIGLVIIAGIYGVLFAGGHDDPDAAMLEEFAENIREEWAYDCVKPDYGLYKGQDEWGLDYSVSCDRNAAWYHVRVQRDGDILVRPYRLQNQVSVEP